MIHRLRSLLPGAALVALLAAPTALRAQDSAGGSEATSTPARTTAPTADRAAPQDEGITDEVAAERSKSRREILKQMRAEEIRHRERLATINRLRELAESQGQAERLALLDKLEVKEGGRYNAAATMAASSLGDTSAYKQSLMKLGAGRIRHNGEPEHPKPAASNLTPEERKARKEAREAKKAAERAAQPATTTKPKTDRKRKVEMVTPPGKSPTAPKVRHKKDAGSTAPGTDPAKPGEPAPAPAPEPAPGDQPKPEEPAPADGGTPRSGS